MIQFIFATDDKPVSVLIRALTSCEWHHVGIVINNDYVIEARFSGVGKVPLSEFKGRGKFKIVDCRVVNERKAIEFANEQIGKKYDFSGLVSFPFRKKWQNSRRWYCSELAAAVVAAGGYPVVREGISGVSPRDLWVATK